MKKRHTLLGALPIIAKMLGRKLGVDVVIGKHNAYTDGKTIYLPPLPDDDETLAILANGYIDHEAAHIRYTDFAIEKPQGLAGELTNLLEDIRIERTLGALYPGSRTNLARLTEFLAGQDSPCPPADAVIAAQVLAALYCQLRAQVLGQTALASYGRALEQRLSDALPEGVIIKLLALAFEVRKSGSTAEVKQLALRIVEMLEEEARRDPPPESGTRADTDSQSQEHHPQPESGSQGGSDTLLDSAVHAGSDLQPASDASPGTKAKVTGDDAKRAALRALLSASATGGVHAPDLGRQAEDLLNAVARQDSSDQTVMAEYAPVPTNHDPTAALRAARAATAQLRRRLAALVQARRHDDSKRSRRGLRLDTRSLYRLYVHDLAIFTRLDERPAPNTAVALLLDRSGSMNGWVSLAAQAVLASALALEDIEGVAVWAAAFPGYQQNQIIPFKGFDERTQHVAGRFRLTAQGGTPLDHALWRAGYELCLRQETRRLLIVATDGQPARIDKTIQLIARCRASGIEVMGLGIGMVLDDVVNIFGSQDAVAIQNIEELASALFKVLEKRLFEVTA